MQKKWLLLTRNKDTTNWFNACVRRKPHIHEAIVNLALKHILFLVYTRTTKALGMCGQEYLWTALRTDKVKCLKMKLRVYSKLQKSFVSSSVYLSLFDNFDIFWTDRQTKTPALRSSVPRA